MVGDPEVCCPAANAARVELMSFSSTIVWRSSCGFSAICGDISQFSACVVLGFEETFVCSPVQAPTGRPLYEQTERSCGPVCPVTI